MIAAATVSAMVWWLLYLRGGVAGETAPPDDIPGSTAVIAG
jgi:hypothetical protein